MSNNVMFELLNGDVDLGKFCDWIAGKETQVIWTKVLVLCLNIMFISIRIGFQHERSIFPTTIIIPWSR